ncbi:MAG: hypothetical protein AB7R89_18730 [Dehalococcoidia bacterium]
MRTTSVHLAANAAITIIHNASVADVAAYEIDPGLNSIIRRPTVRRQILTKLAADPEARLTLAVSGGLIVGHSAAGPSFGRWLDLPHVREVAFEVSQDWRHRGVASQMIDRAMADLVVEDEILLGFLWPSAWDTEHARLSRIAYRDLLTEFIGRYGFRTMDTDEPEIAHQEGGRLIVRIGARVPCQAIVSFMAARFLNRSRRPIAA